MTLALSMLAIFTLAFEQTEWALVDEAFSRYGTARPGDDREECVRALLWLMAA